MKRRRINLLISYCIAWTAAFIFLSIVRGVGTEETGNLQFETSDSFFISILLGPIIGLLTGFSQLWLEEYLYKRISLRKFLATRLVYSIFFMIFMAVSAYFIYALYFGVPITFSVFALEEGSFAIYLYVLVVDFFIAVIRQVNLMLGEGNLMKLIKGQFYHPREENRIFMFLDLQSATSHAERLGHIQYSQLIQDCFNDLGAVIRFETEIIQYVGDEAVLSWEQDRGIRHQNCLKAYFSFQSVLASKKAYYEEKYDCLPFFKAGVHLGTVTVTEVGKYKRDIAYHGDVLNTAARIQGQCNVYKEALLISEELQQELSGEGYQFTPLGTVALKGKAKEVEIVAVAEDMPHNLGSTGSLSSASTPKAH